MGARERDEGESLCTCQLTCSLEAVTVHTALWLRRMHVSRYSLFLCYCMRKQSCSAGVAS